MSLFTLSGWRTSAAIALVDKLPSQTYDTALALVETYLSNVGGWVPENTTDSTGVGQPTNGQTPDEAADSITEEQFAKVHRLTANFNVSVDLDFIANLAVGQSTEDILAQMKPMIETFVRSQLQKTPLHYDSISDLSGGITAGGDISNETRAAIEVSLEEQSFNDDPLAIAVNAARNIFKLDALWSIDRVYKSANGPIVAIIKKYENNTLSTLDNTVTNQYVMSVNPDDYGISGGVFQ